MTGKSEPGRFPALRAGGVDKQNAEHDRQPFAAVDDPHQIGVLQIVVGQLVARIAVFQQDDFVQRQGTPGKIARGARMLRHVASDQLQVIAVAREIDPPALERGQRQRRLGDRQDAPVRGAELAQKALATFGVGAVGRLDHGSRRCWPADDNNIFSPRRLSTLMKT